MILILEKKVGAFRHVSRYLDM